MIFQSKVRHVMYCLPVLNKFPTFTNVNDHAVLSDAPYLSF